VNQNHVKNNRKQTKCYLCLQEMHGKHTKEHVISKVLFRPFQISNPILLNACLECNKKKGYEVYVRRRKVYQKESPYPLSKGEALTFGAEKVLSSAAATFQLRATTEETKTLGLGNAPDLSTLFRAPKRREGPETYVQISTKRIQSPGEVREISLVGVAARTGRPAPRPTSFTKTPSRSVTKSVFTPKKTTSKRPTSFIKSKSGKVSKSGRKFF